MRISQWIFLFLSFFGLSGCVVGPHYKKPEVKLPTQYKIAHSPPQKNRANIHGRWWESFQDRTLNHLIERLEHSNLDLKMATARIEEARAQYKVATSQYFPTLSAQALPPAGIGENNLTQVLGLFLAWVPDFFGKVQSTQNMTKANLEATIADHDWAVLTLSAELANTYWELRGSQEVNALLLKNTRAEQTVYQIAHRNYKSGKDNYISVAQQEAFLETERGELAQNAGKIAGLISKIEILSGENPGELRALLSQPALVPSTSEGINLGVPASLLRRRPDIIAAERRVAAVHANINAAMADLFPSISLGWLLAWQSQTLAANVFSLKNSTQHYYGTFSAPLINLSLYKIVDLKKREKAFAVIQYELTILRALHEVTANYDDYQHRKISALHYQRALKAKALALKLLHNLYDNGALDFNSLLQAEKDLHHLEMQQVESRVATQMALVNLYKALGGKV